MTREDRWLVSLDEIRAIRWECGKCHLAMTFAIDQTVKFPEFCPGCNDLAIRPDVYTEHRAYGSFVDALKTVLKNQRNASIPGTLKMEFVAERTHENQRPR